MPTKQKQTYKSNKKMNAWYEKLWIWACILIIVMTIPFIINELYMLGNKNDTGYTTLWDAKDVLSFYGSILGAFSTILVVIVTIRFTVNQQKLDRKSTVKPFLCTEYRPYYDIDDFSLIKTENTTFITIEKNEIATYKKIPNIISENSMESIIEKTYKKLRFFNDYYLMDYNINNVGSGNALNIDIQINGLIIIPRLSIPTNKIMTFKLIINLNELKNGEETTQKFTYVYDDVTGFSSYTQSETIIMYRDENGSLSSRQNLNDLISIPEEKRRY
jgi:hypothetical protein